MERERSGDVVVRRATSPEDVGRIGREAAWLRSLAGPGVPRLVAHGANANGRVELAVEAVEGVALPDAILTTQRWAEVAVSLTATLARIHRLGAVVGGFSGPEAGGVVIPAVAQPLILDLSRCRPAPLGDASHDVVSLVELLLAALDRATGDDRRRRHTLESALRKPTTAATLARSLAGGSPARGFWAPRLGRRRVLLLGTGTALAIAAVAAVAVATAMPASRSPEPPLDGGALPTRSASTSISTTTTTVVEAEASGVLEWNGRSFALDEGDIGVVGDFDCDGTPSAAALRRSTGDLAIFEAWPEPGSALAGRMVARHPGAIELRTARRNGCDVLIVAGPNGQQEVHQ